MKHIACFVSSPAEVKAALASGADMTYLCGNEYTRVFCGTKGLEAEFLDEERLRPEWSSINRWGFEQPLRLLERFRDRMPAYLYLESNFLSLRALFVQTLKHLFFLERFLIPAGMKEIRFFGGASFFALTCRAAAAFHGWDLRVTLLPPVSVSGGAGWKKRVYDLVALAANILADLRLAVGARNHRKRLLVSGGLKHLGALTRGIARTLPAASVIYAENEFNFEKFRYCLKNGLIFRILPKPPAGDPDARIEGFVFGPGDAVYEGRNLSAILGPVAAEVLSRGDMSVGFDWKKTSDFCDRHGVDAFLLDEDVALRRIFATLAARFGKKCFVVSHGIPIVSIFDDEALRRALRQVHETGTLFVNSEFEKSRYQSILYPVERICVTGLPRYDAAVRPAVRPVVRAAVDASAKKNALYCVCSMVPYDHSSDRMPLFLSKNNYRDLNGRYIEDVLAVFGGAQGVMLGIKPHYDEEKELAELIRRSGVGTGCRLFSHRDDILALEAAADVVITPESSVICEAILADKPVIVMNYSDEPLTSSEYEKYGVIEHVRNKTQLEAALKRCLYDKAYLAALAERRRKAMPYLGGVRDGRNTARVAAHIAAVRQGDREPARAEVGA